MGKNKIRKNFKHDLIRQETLYFEMASPVHCKLGGKKIIKLVQFSKCNTETYSSSTFKTGDNITENTTKSIGIIGGETSSVSVQQLPPLLGQSILNEMDLALFSIIALLF